MPNTLAHIAINVPLTKLGFRQIDLKWVLIGTIIPDIPWILQRVITSLPVSTDPYYLRIYLMIQASLFFSIILSLAFAAFSSKVLKTFLILAFGSLVHLFSDALEVKWANGVHLLAPFDWTITNFGFFWPESLPIYSLTVLGIIFYGFSVKKNLQIIRFRSPGKKYIVIAALLIIYFSVPFLFYNAVLSSNNHYVETLLDGSRAGQYFELDRNFFVDNRKNDYIETFAEEKLYPQNLDLQESNTISIRARFIDNNRINIYEYHVHQGGVRNILSVLGLFLISLYWLYLFVKGWRNKTRAG